MNSWARSALASMAASVALELARAEPPELQRLSPFFWSSSESNRIELDLAHIDADTRVWTSFPCAAGPLSLVTNGRAASVVALPPGIAPGYGWIRLVGRQGISEPKWVAWDSREVAKRAAVLPKQAPPVSLELPAAILGSFKERMVEMYRVPVNRGRPIWVEVIAASLGSKADPFLELRAIHGRRLAFQEDGFGVGADCRLHYLPEETGELLLAIRDTEYGGGPDYRYVLRIADIPWTGATNAVFSVPSGGSSAPTSYEQEPNDVTQKATVWIHGSGSMSGDFGGSGDIDWFRMRVSVAGKYAIRGRTRGLGSGAELRLRWIRSSTAVMAESTLTTGDDALMEASLDVSTDYWVEVGELFGRSRDWHETGVGKAGGVKPGEAPPGGWQYELECFPVAGVGVAVGSVTYQVPGGGKFEIPLTLTYPKDFKSTVVFSVQDAGAGWSLEPREIAGTPKEVRLQVRVPEGATVGAIYSFRLGIGLGGADLSRVAPVSTRAALRKLWPGLVTPPRAVDGWLTVGVVEAPP